MLSLLSHATPCRDLAKQYEKKLEQLKREEELIREEQRELAEALPHDDPDAAKGLVRVPTIDPDFNDDPFVMPDHSASCKVCHLCKTLNSVSMLPSIAVQLQTDACSEAVRVLHPASCAQNRIVRSVSMRSLCF